MQHRTVKILHYNLKSHIQIRFIIIRKMYLKYEKYKHSVCSDMGSVSVLLSYQLFLVSCSLMFRFHFTDVEV